ncbi:hypothetical protein [Dyella choica]|uniref:DUF304 domain-containing protein n=1 Tax=Dyella choica TaxID=1927959 RepID=A0A432LZD8_9GAMM|nr:hypothetical protein [Dyella choica]RUL68994.1 hypothetical protein EKH80_23125 [Dyella choica]
MKTAIVYILTSLTLLIILTFARGKEVAGLIDEFRYRSALLRVLLVFSFIPTVAVAFIYVVAKSKPSGVVLAIFIACGLSSTILFLYGYKYLKSFVVTINENGAVISSIMGVRVIPFYIVKTAIYMSSSGNGGILCLYDGCNKKLIEFSGSISGIEVLARLVEANSSKFGVAFEARDRRF